MKQYFQVLFNYILHCSKQINSLTIKPLNFISELKKFVVKFVYYFILNFYFYVYYKPLNY